MKWLFSIGSNDFNQSMGRAIQRLVPSLLLAFAGASGMAQLQPKPADLKAPAAEQQSTEWSRFRTGIRLAKPMPSGRLALHAPETTPSGNTVHFDPKTQSTFLSGPMRQPLGFATKKFVDSQLGVVPTALSGGSGASQGVQKSPEGTAAAKTQLLSPITDITPTAPSPYGYPYSFPFSTQYRLLLRFNLSGTDYYYLCSASQSASYQLLSAGHCVYNQDIRDDGSNIAGFAAELWAYPAETDVVDPIDHDNWPDYPWGVSKGTEWVTYNDWITNADLNSDFSFITLDRRTGDHLGWMGREWSTPTTALNFDGYPAQAPYVPSNNPFQYPGYDAGNVIAYTSGRIEMSAFTYGGHSGGGVWRYDPSDGSRHIQGVNSTSNRVGYAEATLFTSGTETTLDGLLTQDDAARPPVARPEVIEYVLNNTSKGLNDTVVQIGSGFGLQLNAFNTGFASSGDVSADVYLSTSPLDVVNGTYIGTLDLGSLDAYQYTIQNQTVTVPTTVGPGDWFVGYHLRSAIAQYGNDNPDVIITKQTLHTACTTDAYEYDNAYNYASTLASGGTQTHSICTASDQDWVKFTLNGSSAITLGTSGPSGGDTTLTLYNSNVAQIDFNDDNGTLYSTISHSCASNPLPAGTYYAQVQSYQNHTVIPSYNLSLSTSACPASGVLSAISVSPTSIVAGSAGTGTVTLSAAAAAGGVTVALSTNYSSVHIPAAILIPYGASSGTFGFSVVAGAGARSAQISGVAAGVTKTAVFNVTAPVVAALSGLTLPASIVSGGSATGTVTLSSAAPAGGASVALSTNYSSVHIPATVVVAAGATSANFTATVIAGAAARSAEITAAYGSVTKTANFNVTANVTAALSGITVPASIASGGTATGTVTLTAGAPAGGATVALSTNYSSVHFPASVVVPAGATSAGFTITIATGAGARSAEISAAYSGVTETATFNVTAGVAAGTLSAVSISPLSVPVGGSATGTVTLTAGAPAGGATVALTTNYSSVHFPASVVVPAGATSVNFAVTVAAGAGVRSAEITAAYSGVSKTVTFNVTAATAGALSGVSISPASIAVGGSTTGTVTLTAAAPAGGATVTLSTNYSSVHIPASVVVPAGATSVNFTATVATTGAARSAEITAAYSGVSKTVTFNVTN